MQALHDLQSERHFAIASGVNGTTHWTRVQHGPIPWTAVMAWCERQQIDDDNAELVWSVVNEFDMQQLESEASQRRLNGGI